MAAETTDLIVISRGGVNYKLTLAELIAIAGGGGGASLTPTEKAKIVAMSCGFYMN